MNDITCGGFYDENGNCRENEVLKKLHIKMSEGGWASKKHRSGCDILENCHECKRRYLFTFVRGGEEVKKCPFCLIE